MTSSPLPNPDDMPFTHRERPSPKTDNRAGGTSSNLKNSLPRMAIGYGITSALLIWTGPFNTFELFPSLVRILYWGLINLAGWVLNVWISISIEQLLKKTMHPLTRHIEIICACVAGCLSAIPLAFIVILANQIAHPYAHKAQPIADFPDYMTLLGYIAPLTITVSVLYALWQHNQASTQTGPIAARHHQNNQEEAPNQTVNSRPNTPFFDRLPKHLGQDLLWLSSQDHYLEVKTKLGTELILMRLGDAVKELETYPGARIHRSHWVADASITHLEASEGRLFVHLVDEKILPISRTYRKVPSQRSWPTSRKTAP